MPLTERRSPIFAITDWPLCCWVMLASLSMLTLELVPVWAEYLLQAILRTRIVAMSPLWAEGLCFTHKVGVMTFILILITGLWLFVDRLGILETDWQKCSLRSRQLIKHYLDISIKKANWLSSFRRTNFNDTF